MPKFKLKKGDEVKVLAGKDKGKTGKIIKVYPQTAQVTVEGVNLFTRHQRPKRSRQKGQKVSVPMPLPASRLMLVCPNCGKPSRIGYQISEQGEKKRRCKKCLRVF